ncbi:unnamed protein product [Adineta steineri]|uniref:Fibronectin type-III domain-containing protein n=1 Tax=Adineta steineri TaxID=433720 RepID=A0A818ZF46_9BILA|nr:unnamed protein product [Adineta steineri]CAF3766461.1 unnamed protein product [Adineta steineri]
MKLTDVTIENLESDTGKWIKAATSRFPRCIVENLLPNKQYQFHILAEYIFGAGEPVEPTKTVQTTDSDAGCKRYSGKDDDTSRQKRDLPKLDNYDRCFWDIWDKDRQQERAALKHGSIYDKHLVF